MAFGRGGDRLDRAYDAADSFREMAGVQARVPVPCPSALEQAVERAPFMRRASNRAATLYF